MDNEEKEVYNADEKAEDYAYKNVINEKGKTRLHSVVSIACAVLSVVLFFIPWLGLAFGICAVGFSLMSRKQLEYFEGLALVGLIVGIFGLVFSATGIILGGVTDGSFFFNFL